MGHLFKTAILAGLIRKSFKQVRVSFFIQQDASGIRWLKEKGFPVTVIPDSLGLAQEPIWILEHLPESAETIIVTDILDVSKEYVESFRRNDCNVVTLENKSDSKHVSDLTFNALVEGLKHRVDKKGGSRIHIGSPHRVFHPDYLKWRNRKAKPGKQKKILVSLGGGSDDGFSKILLRHLAERLKNVSVVWIQGPAQEKLSFETSRDSINVAVRGPQDSLARALAESDLAVTAGGGTLYEAAYLGVPAIAFSKRKHQEKNIRLFESAGTALSAGSTTAASAGKAVRMISKLLSDPEKMRRMSNAGKKLCDGKGAGRIIHLIGSLLKGK